MSTLNYVGDEAKCKVCYSNLVKLKTPLKIKLFKGFLVLYNRKPKTLTPYRCPLPN